MKITRVTCKLPRGVVIGEMTGLNWDSLFPGVGRMIPDLFTKTVTVESNTQLTLTLDVPAGLESEVAKLLRGLADELAT